MKNRKSLLFLLFVAALAEGNAEEVLLFLRCNAPEATENHYAQAIENYTQEVQAALIKQKKCQEDNRFNDYLDAIPDPLKEYIRNLPTPCKTIAREMAELKVGVAASPAGLALSQVVRKAVADDELKHAHALGVHNKENKDQSYTDAALASYAKIADFKDLKNAQELLDNCNQGKVPRGYPSIGCEQAFVAAHIWYEKAHFKADIRSYLQIRKEGGSDPYEKVFNKTSIDKAEYFDLLCDAYEQGKAS
jgi:hypothetical protein